MLNGYNDGVTTQVKMLRVYRGKSKPTLSWVLTIIDYHVEQRTVWNRSHTQSCWILRCEVIFFSSFVTSAHFVNNRNGYKFWPALEGRRRERHVQVLSYFFICIQIRCWWGPSLRVVCMSPYFLHEIVKTILVLKGHLSTWHEGVHLNDAHAK